jgi:hypothetical protein
MDPVVEPEGRFREDLEENLRLAEALAPTHCSGCNGYHLERVRRRVAAPADALDRRDMMALLRDWLEIRGVHATEPADILIAGSADTNLLATCAEALSDAGAARYAILDRCRTPLALCEAFVRRHGLEARTLQLDLGSPEGAFAVDVIVVHSLLRFLPRPAHLGTMVALRRWLKPGGAIVFSHRLMAESQRTDPYYAAEYGSVEPLVALFADAGLQIVSLREQIEEGGPRHRVLALLTAR